MFAALLSLLFAASAVLALAVLVSSWRAYGGRALAIWQAREGESAVRQVRYTVLTTQVCYGPAPAQRAFRPLAAVRLPQSARRAA